MENSPARSFDVGSVIADTYTIEALIGRGGMGAVYRASHKRLPGKKVAIKVLHAELADDEVLARFKREAEIAASLGHPSIVGITDFNVLPDGAPYLVLEYLEGETLAQRLRHGPLPLDHTLAIIRQLGSALAAAHRLGIVHRDLKPQNIFLVPTEVDGHEGEVAKILDFGISKIRGSETVKTQEATLLGTPQYMAPEQATGQHSAIDERTDIFALGAIVYEMLTGQPAFSGQSIPEVVFKVVYEQPTPITTRLPALPSTVVAAIGQAMAKPAAERFAHVGDFVEALTGTPLSTRSLKPSTPPPEVGWATGSRRQRPAANDADALAHTVDSGRLAPVIAAPPVRASAPTVESLPGVEIAATVMGPTTQPSATAAPPPPRAAATLGPPTAAPITAPVSRPGLTTPGATGASEDTTTIAPPARSGRGLTIALVLGAALVAGIAVYAVTGRSASAPAPAAGSNQRPDDRGSAVLVANHEAPADGPASPTADAAAPPIDAAVVAIDAGPRPDAHRAIDAGAPRDAARSTAGDQPVRIDDGPAGPPEAGEDEGIAQVLRDAEAAISAGNISTANRLANQATTLPTARPAQRAHGFALKAILACQLSDQEGVTTALRNLPPRFRLLLARVKAACRAQNVTLPK